MNGMNEFERGSQAYQINGTNTPQKSGLAKAALILGIIALCIAIIPIFNLFFLWFGLLPLIFGIVALAKKESTGKSVAGILMGVLSFVLAIGVYIVAIGVVDYAMTLDDEPEQKTTWKDYAEVEFLSFDVTGDSYRRTKLTLRVKNKSDETRDFVVKIEALDEDGDRIATDTVYIYDLGAGQTEKTDAFTLVSDDKIENMQKGKFRVVDVTVR